jgi:MgtE intracellular N domain
MKGKIWFFTLLLIFIANWLIAASSPPGANGLQTAGSIPGRDPEITAREPGGVLKGERARKVLRVYKLLPPEQAATLIDRLDDSSAEEIMNALDQRTVSRIVPFLNPQRVVKWTKESLDGK